MQGKPLSSHELFANLVTWSMVILTHSNERAERGSRVTYCADTGRCSGSCSACSSIGSNCSSYQHTQPHNFFLILDNTLELLLLGPMIHVGV